MQIEVPVAHDASVTREEICSIAKIGIVDTDQWQDKHVTKDLDANVTGDYVSIGIGRMFII
eukprot:15117345-Ditylum_brightwellii.AAC.1